VKKAKKAGVPTSMPAVKRKFPALKQKALQAFENLQVKERAEVARERVSNITAVHIGAAALEWAFLVKKIVPWTYAFSTPALPAVAVQSHDVKVPDLSILGTSLFWGAVWTWVFVSLLVPAAGGYFFNLTQTSGLKTRGIHKVDPVAFNLIKAVVTYVVFTYGFRFGGLLGVEAMSAVFVGVGKDVLFASAGVGGVVGLYDALLRK
jgi:hypothetical protein